MGTNPFITTPIAKGGSDSTWSEIVVELLSTEGDLGVKLVPWSPTLGVIEKGCSSVGIMFGIRADSQLVFTIWIPQLFVLVIYSARFLL